MPVRRSVPAVASLVCLGAIAYGAFYLTGGGPRPYPAFLRGVDDGLLHMLAFGALTACLVCWRRLATALAAAVALAVAVEGLQALLPFRTSSIEDLVASLAGVALVALACSAGRIAATAALPSDAPFRPTASIHVPPDARWPTLGELAH